MAKLRIKRYVTVDAFRGFAVLLMIFVSSLYLLTDKRSLPLFMMHNQGDILLFFDLVAPMFQFILGMSLFFFITHRGAHGFTRKEIARYVIGRYIILILLGFVLDIITYLDICSWGVLETLGVGGLITFIVSERKNNEKAFICVLILVVYSLLYSNPTFQLILSMPHGGPIGALPYSVISILGFVVAQSLYKRKNDTSFISFIFKNAIFFLAVGIILSLIIPFNKTRVSTSFVLVSISIVMLFYMLFFTIYKTLNYKFDRLRLLGRAALTMWVLQYIFGWIFLFVIQKKQFLGLIEGIISSVFVVLIMLLIAYILDKHKIRINF
ncbi:MAG: hypothetical protein QW112_01795 [Candidatus Micrarchaeia archaeon]